MKFVHTNIVAKDARILAEFYTNVFECRLKGKESRLLGEWVEKGTGVTGADIISLVLSLPGYTDGPELEIFQYSEIIDPKANPVSNLLGLGHLAFQVDNVETIMNKAIGHGAKLLGELTIKEFKSGSLTYVYISDPEGNIVEIQNWTAK